MRKKWICVGLLTLLLIAAIFVFYMGQRDKEAESVRQETPMQKQEVTAPEEEKTDTQNGREVQEDRSETDCEIIKAEALTVVEDWAIGDESLVIEDENCKTPELCGISENYIYYKYTVTDDDKMIIVYNMYNRESKKTKKLHELEVRGVVFSAVFYDEHMYILDVSVPSYQIWDISANEAELFATGECLYYPELQLSGSRLMINLYQETLSGVTCILSWTDLSTEESGIVQMTKYRENMDTGNASGTEISNVGGWGDGVIYETFSYNKEPRNTYNRKGQDYGKQELWYYDFRTGKTTKQVLTLGQHSYYVGGR